MILRDVVLVVVLALVPVSVASPSALASAGFYRVRMLSNNEGVPACTPDSVPEYQLFVDGTGCGCNFGEVCYTLHYNPIGDCSHPSGPAQWKTVEWWCAGGEDNLVQVSAFLLGGH